MYTFLKNQIVGKDEEVIKLEEKVAKLLGGRENAEREMRNIYNVT
jgi:hypothetical protein